MRRCIVVSEPGAFAVTLRDITDEKKHMLTLDKLANTDSVTGLPNRHWLNSYLPQCLAHAAEMKTKVALLFIDLDDFKNLNNTEGHAAGDALLHAVGQRIKSLLRPGDHVVRLGGDEFTVVLDRVTEPAQVLRVASRLEAEMASPYELAQYGFQIVKASIGISLFPEHGTNMETLLQHADIAMYAAKSSGKGKYEFYAPNLSSQIVAKVSMLQALRHAIEADEFVLHYQPRVDAQTGELRSFEALVRWQHPERGMVPPIDFIPLAEETGLIVELGELVLRKACAQIAEWQASELPVKPVSVNVSARQFQAQSLEATVKACLSWHGVVPSLLELEITESCMMADQVHVAKELAALKRMGVRISVDDFGTGYSSLAQLQQLDLDVLKVDRTFTNLLTAEENGQAFFSTIISMARVLNMEVVAEGVETPEQLGILQSLGCTEVQGFFVSKPVPESLVPGMLQQRFFTEKTPSLF